MLLPISEEIYHRLLNVHILLCVMCFLLLFLIENCSVISLPLDVTITAWATNLNDPLGLLNKFKAFTETWRGADLQLCHTPDMQMPAKLCVCERDLQDSDLASFLALIVLISLHHKLTSL